MSNPAGHHLIHSEAFVDQGEPVASTSEFAPDKPDLTPEQDLRATVAERLADAIHFNGCTDEPCTCLVGRLHWAISAEQVAS